MAEAGHEEAEERGREQRGKGGWRRAALSLRLPHFSGFTCDNEREREKKFENGLGFER